MPRNEVLEERKTPEQIAQEERMQLKDEELLELIKKETGEEDNRSLQQVREDLKSVNQKEEEAIKEIEEAKARKEKRIQKDFKLFRWKYLDIKKGFNYCWTATGPLALDSTGDTTELRNFSKKFTVQINNFQKRCNDLNLQRFPEEKQKEIKQMMKNFEKMKKQGRGKKNIIGRSYDRFARSYLNRDY